MIDARAEGLEPADVIFIFGTRLDTPARIAADLFRRGLAPLVVATGGAGRQADGLNEAAHHVEILVKAGVPREVVIVEDRSTTTTENVAFALPLIEARIGPPRSVIAVVKRHHRRALITMARLAPTIERFFVADYQPEAVTRDRLERELEYIRELIAQRVDPLVTDGNGWRRSDA
jgi:uncharacterized SAM-binding protein YcdF (DUF218 family)